MALTVRAPTDDLAKMADAVEKALRAIDAAGGLVSAAEIAAEWGVTKATVSRWVAAGKFPEPVKVVGRVRLYLRDQVEPLRRDAA